MKSYVLDLPSKLLRVTSEYDSKGPNSRHPNCLTMSGFKEVVYAKFSELKSPLFKDCSLLLILLNDGALELSLAGEIDVTFPFLGSREEKILKKSSFKASIFNIDARSGVFLGTGYQNSKNPTVSPRLSLCFDEIELKIKGLASPESFVASLGSKVTRHFNETLEKIMAECATLIRREN